MTENIKRDSLGRRIPEFDRSAANKKGVETQRRRDKDYYKKFAKKGGHASKGGYFQKLKETDPEALREIGRKAAQAKRDKRLRENEGLL